MKATEPGFSVIELIITVGVMSVLFAFAVPAFLGYRTTHHLKGAAENVAGQLRLARDKAMGTGVPQPVHFEGTAGYHIHYPTGIGASWTLPRGVRFASTMDHWFTMSADGRCSTSGLIVLRDARGSQDTVSVQLSGLVSRE